MFDNVVEPAAASARERFEAPPARSRRPLAALGAHPADLRAGEPQAGLLSLDGVPDRPLADQQHHQPAARSVRRRRARGRASTGSHWWSRSPTPAWATAGLAAWPPVSSTRWPRCSFRRWATACATSTASSGRPSRTAGSGTARQLAASSRSLGGRSSRRGGGGQARLLVRSRGGSLRSCRVGPRACSASPTIVRSWATAARPSTRCGSGAPPPTTTSTSRSSAAAISSARVAERLAANR